MTLAALSSLDQHRHVLLTLGLSAILSTLWCAHLRRDVFFWPPVTEKVWAIRAEQVKEAFRHAYHGYEQYAFPHDELLPLSNGSVDK